MQNQELAEWLDKPIIRKFEKPKAHSSFTEKNLRWWSCRYAIHKLVQ